jgi:hypothetical protein
MSHAQCAVVYWEATIKCRIFIKGANEGCVNDCQIIRRNLS